MTQVFGFNSEAAIDRVISAVRKVEGSRPPAQSPRASFGSPTALLKITGEEVGDVQPADVISWDHAADAETIIGDGVRFKELNGLALSVGTYVMGRMSGFTSDGAYALFIGAVVARVRAKIKGVLDGSLAYASSATMSVWEFNGVGDADTGENVTVYDWLLSSGQSIASGKNVTAFWDAASGRYYVDGAQCP